MDVPNVGNYVRIDDALTEKYGGFISVPDKQQDYFVKDAVSNALMMAGLVDQPLLYNTPLYRVRMRVAEPAAAVEHGLVDVKELGGKPVDAVIYRPLTGEDALPDPVILTFLNTKL